MNQLRRKRKPLSLDLIHNLGLVSEIETKKVAQEFMDRLTCPLCPKVPPQLQDKKQLSTRLWNKHVKDNLVATPERLEPEAGLACTVCAMIISMEALTEKAIK